jgi:caa(3)-type oxidase subunit IV
MKSLVRTDASRVWLILIVLTVVSWTLGADHAFGTHHVPTSLVIIAVAIFKIRLIGMYFMELRDAPLALRNVFESYCIVLLALLTGMYLLA